LPRAQDGHLVPASHNAVGEIDTGEEDMPADRPLFLVVTIKPKPDRTAQAEAQLQSMRHNSLNEPGCVFMHLTQPQDDPDSWVMLEMFRSRADWDQHMQQPYNTEGNRILEDLLREPSDLRLLDEKEG